MNDKAFEDKVIEDVDQAKLDLATLGDDGVTGLSRIFEQLADNVKETATAAVQTVEQGLSQYNAKVQAVADQVPGGFAKKAAGYPWVTITITLALGLLLGGLLKPGRRPLG